MTRRTARAGFGLIELLVAISIILLLSGLVFVMYPGARDADRVRNTVTDVGSACKLAQGMAARDKRPRGVRFIVDGTNKPGNDPRLVTELQYIELPPPLIANLKPLTPSAQNPNANPDLEPRVRFTYTATATSGALAQRICIIENLTAEQAAQVQAGCTIVMPTFGTWHRIIAVPTTKTLAKQGNPSAIPPSRGTPAIALVDLEVQLEVFPDTTMGGGTSAHIHHFAIYLNATPLVGEPTVLLPKDICVDLTAYDPGNNVSVGSIGPARNLTTDFDVIFGPDGKLVNAPAGQLFLLVRDYTKNANFRVPQGLPLLDAFRKSGETYFLTLRGGGTVGSAPVTWPDNTGAYTGGQDPFTLARQGLN